MMEFLVNGLPVFPREDIDFEYNSENNFFSDSDGYTLSVEFPLRGVPENIRVFGHIHREDVAKESVLLDCSIRCGAFFRSGSLSVVDVSESSVKTQFIEGIRPEDEELSVDSLYIDEMDLGSYPVSLASQISVKEAREGTESEVCYPWLNVDADVVNNLSYPHAYSDSPSELRWHEDTVYLSWQPYLKVIVSRVAEACGYSLDFSAIAGTEWENVIICNSVPGVWLEKNYAAALPHWKASDFFKNIGLIMKGVFAFDHTAKSIRFSFYSSVGRQTILLEDVADEYQASISRDEEDADFLPVMKFKYPDQDFTIWKYLCCPWILDSPRAKRSDNIFDNMVQYNQLPEDKRPDIFFVRALDSWYCVRQYQINISSGAVPEYSVNVKYPYKYVSFYDKQPLNVFGPPDYDEDAKYDSLECSPAPVDYALEGKMMWLPFAPGSSDVSSSGSEFSGGVVIPGHTSVDGHPDVGSNELNTFRDRVNFDIQEHDNESNSGLYSNIFLGIVSPNPSRFPFPITDIELCYGQTVASTKLFRLSSGSPGGVDIDPEVKYTFKFISGSIPDVSSIFVIHGQKYICRKITASFSRFGMSRILKGEFFRCV